MRPLPAQIKIAVTKPDIFTGIFIRIHLNRKCICCRLKHKLINVNFNAASWQGGVDGFFRARPHCPGNCDNRFIPDHLNSWKRSVRAINNTLCQPVMIPQVNKHHTAMVTFTMDPARQTNYITNVFRGQLSAMMGTVGMHLTIFLFINSRTKNAP